MSVSLTGSDTVVIAGLSLLDFADADNALLDFPDDISVVKVGKNGNAIYALNNSGLKAEVTLRMIRGSHDDKFLNRLLAQQQLDFAAFVLLDGMFNKRAGDGTGNITNDTYYMAGGVFKKQVGAKSNAEGDTEQSLAIYVITFGNTDRHLL